MSSKQEQKPGIKTSEFWLTLGAQLLSALAVGLGQASPSVGVQIASIFAGAATSVLSLFGYQSSRAKVKSAIEGVQLVQGVLGRTRR